MGGKREAVDVVCLVAVFGQCLLRLAVRRSFLCFGKLSSCGLLSFVVCGALDLSSLLESVEGPLLVNVHQSLGEHPLRTLQQRLGISSRPHGPICQLCSTFGQALI